MLIGDPVLVPGNASRYFDDPETALVQPFGRLGVTVSDAGHLHNALFAPELIRYDASYLTTSCNVSGSGWLPTLDYFPQVLKHWPNSPPSVCDVGCGQGELVTALRGRGVDAVGFDPVLRAPGEHLHQDYWSPQDPRGDADLLVMRCVLPHIAHPWVWLENAASRPRHVLIEYQRIEWLIERSVWYGLNHDHANYFQLHDFAARYEVVEHGEFADDEWTWILIRIDVTDPRPTSAPTSTRESDAMERTALHGVSKLTESRVTIIEDLQQADRPVVLWGAAGKGVVAADALRRADVPVAGAVDLDRNKWGRFLECSGIEVLAPERLRSGYGDAMVAVSNPRHIDDVRKLLGAGWAERVISLAQSDFQGMGGR